jgi:adenylyltransferase/sulfurtransferase
VIAGCGGLGAFAADLLCRAGVGRLILIDRDYVEFSNLQRQSLYEEADAAEGLPKAVAAARRLRAVNPDIEIQPEVADLTSDNIARLFQGAHVVLDGTDNFETRYLINDYCVKHGIPWIYGGAVATHGTVMPVKPGETACLKCVYPVAPPNGNVTCETVGVLNTVPALIATIQASEALKILAGKPEQVAPRITAVDVWTGIIRQVRQPGPDPECIACGKREWVHLEAARRAPVTLCGRNAVQIHEQPRRLDLERLAERLRALGEVRLNPYVLRFSIPPYEMTVFPDGRAIIKGTMDTGLARSLYARYIGA